MADKSPPAFPRDERYLGHNGMSLRDYFAAQVMPAVFRSVDAEIDARRIEPEKAPQTTAQVSYQIADAMLAARNA